MFIGVFEKKKTNINSILQIKNIVCMKHKFDIKSIDNNTINPNLFSVDIESYGINQFVFGQVSIRTLSTQTPLKGNQLNKVIKQHIIWGNIAAKNMVGNWKCTTYLLIQMLSFNKKKTLNSKFHTNYFSHRNQIDESIIYVYIKLNQIVVISNEKVKKYENSTANRKVLFDMNIQYYTRSYLSVYIEIYLCK